MSVGLTPWRQPSFLAQIHECVGSCLVPGDPSVFNLCLSGEHSHTHKHTLMPVCSEFTSGLTTFAVSGQTMRLLKRWWTSKDVAKGNSETTTLTYFLCLPQTQTFALISVWFIKCLRIEREPQSVSPDGFCLRISGMRSAMMQGLFHLQEDVFRLWLCQLELLLWTEADINTGACWNITNCC